MKMGSLTGIVAPFARSAGLAPGRLAGLAQLLFEDAPHPGHALGAVPGLLPVAQEALDVAQREAHLLQLLDPVHALDGVGAVEAVAAGRTSDGPEQAELLVEVHGPD